MPEGVAAAAAPAAPAPESAPAPPDLARNAAASAGQDAVAATGRELLRAPARRRQALDALFDANSRQGVDTLESATPETDGLRAPPLAMRAPLRSRLAAVWRKTADAARILPDPERNRAFWRWTLGQAVVNAGMSVQLASLPTIMGAGAAQAGDREINRAAGWTAQAASSLLTGPLLDRKPPLTVVARGYAAAGLILLAAPLLLVAGLWSFAAFTLLSGAAGFAMAAAQNAGAVVYNRILGDEVASYNKANGWLAAINSAVGVITPLAGAALLARLGPAAAARLPEIFRLLHLGAAPRLDAALFGGVLSCAVYAGALFAAAAGYRRFLRAPAAAGPAAAAAPRSASRDIFTGLRMTFGHRVLRRYLLLSALRVAAADALIFALLPSFLSGLPAIPFAFALILSSANLGAGTASVYLALAKNRRSTPGADGATLEKQGRVSALMRAASWMFYAGLFFSGSAYLAAALLFLNSLFQTPANIIWGGLTTKAVSQDFPRDQGKVYSAMSFYWIAITLLGALAFGPVLAPFALAVRLKIAVGALLACAVFDLALARYVFPSSRAAANAKAAAAEIPAPLRFSVHEGSLRNYFFRRGGTAAHLLASSGAAPRLIVAFPAEDSGIGLWFDAPSQPVALDVVGEVSGVERADGLRGVSARVSASAALSARGAVLGSLRTLRDYAHDGILPTEIVSHVEPGPPVVVRRTTLDGRHHFELRLEGLDGARVALDERGRIALSGPPGRTLEFQLTALTDYPPLTPIAREDLLSHGRTGRDFDALAFLSYKEKLLAGSWRFLTYFGRDTLMSTRLLLPALSPETVEAGLGAVLDRLSPAGEVAHEEDIGDFAALRRLREGADGVPLETPFYDYKMIDDDFMLAPLAAAYLLDTKDGRARAAAFLARKTPSGLTYAAALQSNLDRVRRLASPFAAAPSVENLIHLKPGQIVGEWRDSGDGLGGGRTPFDVNAALVPAALDAGARLQSAARPEAAAEFARLARAWAGAARFFRVEIPADAAAARLQEYAREQGLALAAGALPKTPVRFHALALDAAGRPIPVMNTDEGFAMLFTLPSAEHLGQIAANLCAPFPLGLNSPVGVPIANPAYLSDPAARALFSPAAYHGAVVWSWQQALLAAGLARQLERTDLSEPTRSALRRAQMTVWEAIKATEAMRHSELWSWTPVNGRMTIQPFGQGAGDADESNAAQLWSTVYLAVKPPRD